MNRDKSQLCFVDKHATIVFILEILSWKCDVVQDVVKLMAKCLKLLLAKVARCDQVLWCDIDCTFFVCCIEKVQEEDD